jgi:putative hydrolase of the HAD superfamily
VPVEDMIDLARRIKKGGVQVIILSNNFKERAEFYGHYPWLHEVADKVYFSWQTGFVKPDERAWQLVLRENNLEPSEVLYCDDQERNNKVARSLGLETHSYSGVAELEEFLIEQGLKL